CGLGIVILGIGLALPLPIPGSNAIFIAPIIVYAIGLLENDGALVLLGHVATVVLVLLGILFWVVVKNALIEVWRWLHAAFGKDSGRAPPSPAPLPPGRVSSPGAAA